MIDSVLQVHLRGLDLWFCTRMVDCLTNYCTLLCGLTTHSYKWLWLQCCSMAHELDTVDGTVTIESVGCDSCDESNVRISDNDIAYERNRHGTYVRHNCNPGV